MVKVFVVMHYNYDETDFGAIFSTREKAEEFIKDKTKWPKYSLWIQEYLSIEEVEIDKYAQP